MIVCTEVEEWTQETYSAAKVARKKTRKIKK
jgi:hypothetical protein